MGSASALHAGEPMAPSPRLALVAHESTSPSPIDDPDAEWWSGWRGRKVLGADACGPTCPSQQHASGSSSRTTPPHVDQEAMMLARSAPWRSSSGRGQRQTEFPVADLGNHAERREY